VKNRRAAGFLTMGATIVTLSLILESSALAQTAPAGQAGARGAAPRASQPTPRFPDGTPNLGPVSGAHGFWDGGGSMASQVGAVEGTGGKLPTNLPFSEIPFQPWARALFDYRRENLEKDDPHARCIPNGGIRQLQTPFGLEIIQAPHVNRIYILSGGGNHTFRVVFLDGRPHPDGDEVNPTYFGHSVGRWEGDTLVIDTVGYNERFWFARSGYPHTEQMHLTERISRPDFDTLRYEATIDDPGAYTKPWTGGFIKRWNSTTDLEEYFCTDNNKDATKLIGQ
jgi:hypothetical protein